jgi:hypothetical protein
MPASELTNQSVIEGSLTSIYDGVFGLQDLNQSFSRQIRNNSVLNHLQDSRVQPQLGRLVVRHPVDGKPHEYRSVRESGLEAPQHLRTNAPQKKN